jgi:hypothetical protein
LAIWHGVGGGVLTGLRNMQAAQPVTFGGQDGNKSQREREKEQQVLLAPCLTYQSPSALVFFV